MLTPHPQRIALHNEVHARPYEKLTAPLMLSHLAMLAAPDGASQEHLNRLLRDHHLPLPAAGASYLSTDLGGLRLRVGQLHHRVAAGFLVAAEHQGVERERVAVGDSAGFFHQGGQHAGFGGG